MDTVSGRSLRDGLSPTVEPVPVSPAVAASIPSAGDWRLCGADRGGCSCLQIWSKSADAPVAKVNSGEWGDEYPSLRVVGPSMQATAEAYMERDVYGHVPIESAKIAAFLIHAAPDLLAVAHMYLEDADRWKFDGPGVRAARAAIEKASAIEARSGETRTRLDPKDESAVAKPDAKDTHASPPDTDRGG